jgi:hypothetical protein
MRGSEASPSRRGRALCPHLARDNRVAFVGQKVPSAAALGVLKK